MAVAAFGLAVGTSAQIKAITENGDEVMLNPNGTWNYVEADNYPVSGLKLNDKEFEKPSASSFLIKSKTVDVGIYLNPKQWSFKKAESNEDAEYEFQLKNEDAYGMIIAERLSIPLETLKDIAFENAKSVSSDLRIVEQEYRMVNGLKVIYMVMAANVRGKDVYYYGYYYSTEKGSVQLLCYTGASMAQQYEKDILDLLNGLVPTS